MRSPAMKKAEDILEEKGFDLTEKDVKKIDQLVNDFTEEEKENDIVMIYGTIEQLKENPKAKLYNNGRT